MINVLLHVRFQKFPFRIITFATSSGKRIVTVWRPSVCLSRQYILTLTHQGAACDTASVHFGQTIGMVDLLRRIVTVLFCAVYKYSYLLSYSWDLAHVLLAFTNSVRRFYHKCVSSEVGRFYVSLINAKLIIFTARRYADAVYAVIMCLSVCLSVTSRSSTKMAKPRIT